jgi:hypothetical protein
VSLSEVTVRILSVASPGLLVEGGRNRFDTATAVDVGFKLKRFHDD